MLNERERERNKERGRKKCYFSTDEIFLLLGTKQTEERENKTEKLSNLNFISPRKKQFRNRKKKNTKYHPAGKEGGESEQERKNFCQL